MRFVAAAAVIVALLLAGPLVLYHFGEADLFWTVVMEIIGAIVSIAAMLFIGVANLDFR